MPKAYCPRIDRNINAWVQVVKGKKYYAGVECSYNHQGDCTDKTPREGSGCDISSILQSKFK